MPSRRVAACVVTGFLGSGKTTLLRGLLDRAPSPERIAVVVNEIGEIGIDGRVIAGFEFAENVVELASGCVCCSIDEYRFDLAVDELVRRLDPALLVIETSGVADPAPTLERLRRCGLGVDAVVTVVDARAWRTAWRMSAVARRQARAADFLVVSKADLVPPRALAKLRSKLSALNPRALLLEGARGAAFPGSELLLATSASSAARRSAPAGAGAGTGPPAIEGPLARTRSSAAGGRRPLLRASEASGPESARADFPDDSRGHLERDGIETFAWTSSRRFERAAFEHALTRLPREVLRAKGLLARADGPGAWLFQVVCGRVETTAFEGAVPGGTDASQGVFIGPGIARLRDRIVAALESVPSVANEPAGEHANGHAIEKTMEPASEPANGPANIQTNGPVHEPASEAVNEPASKPASKPG